MYPFALDDDPDDDSDDDESFYDDKRDNDDSGENDESDDEDNEDDEDDFDDEDEETWQVRTAPIPLKVGLRLTSSIELPRLARISS